MRTKIQSNSISVKMLDFKDPPGILKSTYFKYQKFSYSVFATITIASSVCLSFVKVTLHHLDTVKDFNFWFIMHQTIKTENITNFSEKSIVWSTIATLVISQFVIGMYFCTAVYQGKLFPVSSSIPKWIKCILHIILFILSQISPEN